MTYCISLLGIMCLLVVAAHVWQTVLWERERKLFQVERARFVDAVLAKNAGDFRVRQTTEPTRYGDVAPRIAQPNARSRRPAPIGLDGGAF